MSVQKHIYVLDDLNYEFRFDNVSDYYLSSISVIEFLKLFLVQWLFSYLQLSNISSLLFFFYIIILVLSYGVVVGENIIVPDFTRISLLKRLIVVRSVDCYLHLIFAPHFLPPSYPSPSSPHTHTHTYTHTHTHTAWRWWRWEISSRHKRVWYF